MTFTNLKERIENIKPFQAWLLFIIIYVSFSPEVLWRPFIFAEDTVFLNNALTDGFKSLFYRHAEYWEIISRLAGNIAIFLGRGANSYLVATFFMKAVAISFTAYYIIYFTIADFSWLVRDRCLRFVISFILLVWFGNFINSYYNVTNIHWAGEFFLFLVGMNLVFHNKFPSKFCMIICLLTCLNSPEACLVLIPFALYILNRIMDRKIRLSEMAAYLLVFAATSMQFYVVKNSGNGANVTNLSIISSAVAKSSVAALSASSYVLSNEIRSYLSYGQILLSGSLIWIFIVFSYIKIGGTKWGLFVLYALIFLFLHYMTVYIKYSFIWGPDTWVNSSPGAVAALFFFCATVYINSIFKGETVKRIILVFLAVILISQVSHAARMDGLGQHYKRYDYDMLGMKLIEETNKTVDFNSRTYKTLTLYANWNLLIPVRP